MPERNQADSQCNSQTALISECGSLGRILNYNIFKSDVSLMPSNIVKKTTKIGRCNAIRESTHITAGYVYRTQRHGRAATYPVEFIQLLTGHQCLNLFFSFSLPALRVRTEINSHFWREPLGPWISLHESLRKK